jgi:MIP family channel proteins
MSTSTPSAQRLIAEMLGTFTLVVLGPGAVMVADLTGAFGHIGVALAFGLAITIIVASIGHISGAHVNPAVTIGLWSLGRFPLREVGGYLVAQIAGATAAAALLVWMLGPVGNFGVTVPSIPLAQAFVVELGFTGVLGFMVAATADERFSKAIAPLVLGATIGVGALLTGPLTGGSFNPARSLGPALVGGVWDAHWIYWVAPIVGALLGMRVYGLVHGLMRR